MQTILGSGGSIGNELAKVLPQYTGEIRLVSRNPKAVNPTDQLFSCDLTDKSKLTEALKDSEVAYLVAGIPYQTKVWQKLWTVIMQNTIDACKENGTRLVFFDNMYLYDPEHISFMTEETPVNPGSKKGNVRAGLARMIAEEIEKGNLNALIARSADFYGPGVNSSILMIGVYNNFKKGKKANWFCSLNHKHSFTYTPDAAKATALLGNDKEAYNQVWHLPTAKEPKTGREWIEAFAAEMKVKPKVQLATKPVVRIMGLFNPVMKEFVEMLYQYDRDYIFDSSKFEKAYDFIPVSYGEGIKRIVQMG
jgi:nucleoside-diphosphate-sugar epimerase